MALKIRLSRGGSKKRPFYRIVVAEAAAPRDGRYVERVGHYNPMVPKEHENRLSVNGERVKFWMDRGAQPTDRVHKLLSLVDILKAPEIRDQPKKSAIGKKRAEREAEAAEASAVAEEAPAEEAAQEASAVAEGTGRRSSTGSKCSCRGGTGRRSSTGSKCSCRGGTGRRSSTGSKCSCRGGTGRRSRGGTGRRSRT